MPAAKEKISFQLVARFMALLLFLAATAASAQARSAAENRVWQKSAPITESLLSQPRQLLELHQVKAPLRWYDAPDYTFAAEVGPPAPAPENEPTSVRPPDAAESTPAKVPSETRIRTGPNGELQSAFAKVNPEDIGNGTPTTDAARDLARRLGNATDDAGHARGSNLGGKGGATSGNIFPQAPSVNRGAFAQFEQQVARQVQAGNEVYIRVVPRYAPGATRPFEISYQVRVNGVTTTRVFPNP